ncbi:MAG: leucine-rich repeat domain-containing protein [Nostoc sp.]|uniref:leucine-rich repeat domain-containing protein n=1 Tax=Nostoc sp. TaxID=1180 RepID=UPI002FFC03FC
MKLTLSIATIFTFALGFYTTQTIAAPLENPKSFTDWCEQKSTLPPQTKHTVEVLLETAQTQNCKEANQKLTNLTYLNLNSNKISNIKPLSAMTNLTSLSLESNEISDIKLLSNLTNLTILSLDLNQISDIKPLSALTKLEILNINKNPIAHKICPVKPESICQFDWPQN